MYNVFSNKKTVLCTLLLTVAECGKEKRFLTGSSYLSPYSGYIALRHSVAACPESPTWKSDSNYKKKSDRSRIFPDM